MSPQTAELVRAALGYCRASRGCFDITMGTVTSLWNFHTGEVPSKLALSRALPHVGIGRIELGGDAEHPTLAIRDPATVTSPTTCRACSRRTASSASSSTWAAPWWCAEGARATRRRARP